MHQENYIRETDSVVEQQIDLEVSGNEFEEFNDILLGVVTGCERLNVRKEPSSTAAIVCEIENKTEVMIEESESTEDFYKVFTVSGIDGFCMRKFIEIKS